MAVKTVAHLNFRGEARAALSFYQSVFGGELAAVTHAQVYGTKDPVEADLVSWGQVVSPEGFAIMAFDVPSAMEWDAGKIPFFVSIRADNEAEGATVIQPLAGSTWAKLYGMLKDRFGVTWVLDVPAYSD
jgi:PhnB protein